MSEVVAATGEPAAQPATLLSMPGQKLDDGTFRLASGKAFVVRTASPLLLLLRTPFHACTQELTQPRRFLRRALLAHAALM